MTTTVYFAENAYFLKRQSIREIEEEEVREQLGQAMQFLGMPGGAPSAEDLVTQGGKHPLGALRRQKIRSETTSTFTDAGDMLHLLGASISGEKPSAIPLPPHLVAHSVDPLAACQEKIEVERLDEGFCVRHHKPIDEEKLSDVGNVGRPEDEEWKGPDEKHKGWVVYLSRLMGGLGNALGRGTVDVLGFKSADEVVEYVRQSCRDRA